MGVWKKLLATNSTTTLTLENNNPERGHQRVDIVDNTYTTNHITITAHFGISKLRRFQIMMERWGNDGPISASIYITQPSEIMEILKFQIIQR